MEATKSPSPCHKAEDRRVCPVVGRGRGFPAQMRLGWLSRSGVGFGGLSACGQRRDGRTGCSVAVSANGVLWPPSVGCRGAVVRRGSPWHGPAAWHEDRGWSFQATMGRLTGRRAWFPWVFTPAAADRKVRDPLFLAPGWRLETYSTDRLQAPGSRLYSLQPTAYSLAPFQPAFHWTISIATVSWWAGSLARFWFSCGSVSWS